MARLLHVPLSLILCGAIPAGLKARPIHDAAFFDKDGGKPILRKFENTDFTIRWCTFPPTTNRPSRPG